MKRTVPRRIVTFMSVLVIAMILASLSFIVLETDHECHGRDCHVCAVIFQCNAIVRGLGSTVLHALFASAAVALLFSFAAERLQAFFVLTPVTSKVRLND